MANSGDQFILVAIKGSHHRPVKGPAIIQIIASERGKLKKEPQWRGWEFQVRDPEAYKAMPILESKNGSALNKVKKKQQQPTWQPYKD